MKTLFRWLVATLWVVALGWLAIGLGAQTSGQPERFVAASVNPNTGRAGMVQIVVDRWSTDAERDRLIMTARERGADKLLDVVQSLPRAGYIRTPDSIGWDLHYARRTPVPDGAERIVLVTDRPIGFWEDFHQLPSTDYPFTVIEIRMNPNGTGEGRMSLATKIIVDPEQNQITLENYEAQPVLLTNVEREKK